MGVALICFVIALIGLSFLAYEFARAKSNKRLRRNELKYGYMTRGCASRYTENKHPSYKKLLSMVGGDRSIADRLADTYGVDKAIEQLIRDRR